MTTFRHPIASRRAACRASALAAVAVAATAAAAAGQGVGGGLDVQDAAAMVNEKLGAAVPGDIPFTDQTGASVRLGDFFTGQRPIVLNLGYLSCPRVCGATLRGLLDSLADQPMVLGRDYDLLTVSFDDQEKPELAAAKKESHVARWPGLPLQANWSILTGDAAPIRRLTDAVGFGFAKNEVAGDINHQAVTIFLSPDGRVMRYIYGESPSSRDLRFAIVESGQGKVGSTVDRILLSCYGYDPTTRTYSVLAIRVMQVGGLGVLIGLVLLVVVLRRAEKRVPTPAPQPSLVET